MTSEFLEELRRVLDYNPVTGVITWKVARNGNQFKAGIPAGTVNNGRLVIYFRSKLYKAHRLAWLLTFGKWPEKMIDHIDGDPMNNRISNLRDVSQKINLQNQRKPRSNNKSGFLGVSSDKQSGKFRAMIKINGKLKHLGYFLTAEEGYAAYLTAKQKFHDGCTIQ